MLAYKEPHIEKMYWGIGEVAKMYGVNTSMLRFWEKEFDILKPKKNRKGDRFFTKQDMENIALIYHLVKEKGFTLKGAKKMLEENRDKTLRKIQIIESLEKVKKFLLEISEKI